MSNSRTVRNLLLLCDYNLYTAQTIFDHIEAFKNFSRNRVLVLPMKGDLPRDLVLDRFDGVLIHYSLTVSNDRYLSSQARLRLRNYDGWKGVFVQDDYRFVNRTVEALKALKIHALFCLAPEDVREAVYSSEKLPRVAKVTVLAGYVQEGLNSLQVLPYVDRKFDVGYRARKLPAWIGSHAQEKSRIAERFLHDAPDYKLQVDISCREEDRIYGEAWINFVQNCKAMLGTESGSSVCDFTGEIQRAVERHEQNFPEASFDELRDLYFKHEDGKVMMNIISPRCFEAASLRTLMILYPGHYSGVLKPWRHYVPLQKDHSNMAEVVSVLRDSASAQAIIQRAYDEVALNPKYSYAAMIEEFDGIVDKTFRAEMLAKQFSYSPDELRYLSGTASREHGLKSVVDNVAIFVYRVGHWVLRAAVSKSRQAAMRRSFKNVFTWLSSRMQSTTRTLAESKTLVTGMARLPSFFLKFVFDSRVHLRCRIQAVREAVLLEEIRRSSPFAGLRGTWLVWDSNLGILRLIGYDSEQPRVCASTPLGRHELVELLCEGRVKHLVWDVNDLEGIGPIFPLNVPCTATELLHLARYYPDYIADFITSREDWNNWCERMLVVMRSGG